MTYVEATAAEQGRVPMVHAIRRAAIAVVVALWACVPFVYMYRSATRLLPGMSFEYAFGGLGRVVCWTVVTWLGLALWQRNARNASKLLLGMLASVVMAAAALFLARLLPWEWTVGVALERALERHELEGEFEVRGDGSFAWHGVFIREDAPTSDAELAHVIYRDWDAFVLRERSYMDAPRSPTGTDRVLLYPLRDGWWYLLLDL